MKILYFERQHGNSYSYYNEIKSSLGKDCTIYQYPYWSPDGPDKVNIEEVLSRCPEKPDLICFGFGWTDCGENEPKKIEGLSDCDIPVSIILNKEYAALDKKLDWIVKTSPIAAFTVHHDYKLYEEKTGVPFYQIPFAVNPNIFKKYDEQYDCDFGFSGVIRPEQTNDWRAKIVEKSKDWSDINFSFSQHMHDSLESYARRLNRSKMWLSTTGPADLVGPRYYEIMALGTTLLVCNRLDKVYDGLFEEDKHCVMFDSIEELEEKIRYYLKNQTKRIKIVESAKECVLNNHTWDHRARRMISGITENLEKKLDE
jgi:spore maturation protein CgeB